MWTRKKGVGTEDVPARPRSTDRDTNTIQKTRRDRRNKSFVESGAIVLVC
jgi:hypothetical protein